MSINNSNKDRRIGVYFKTGDEYDVVFSKLADIIKKMLDYFAPITFGKKEMLMKKQVIAKPLIKPRFASVETEYPEESIVTEDSYRIQLEERSERLSY